MNRTCQLLYNGMLDTLPLYLGSMLKKAVRVPMASHEDIHDLGSREPIQTDEEALQWLPRFLVVQQAYTAFRAEGKTPEEAIQQTMALWREFNQAARPDGYGKGKG